MISNVWHSIAQCTYVDVHSHKEQHLTILFAHQDPFENLEKTPLLGQFQVFISETGENGEEICRKVRFMDQFQNMCFSLGCSLKNQTDLALSLEMAGMKDEATITYEATSTFNQMIPLFERIKVDPHTLNQDEDPNPSATILGWKGIAIFELVQFLKNTRERMDSPTSFS